MKETSLLKSQFLACKHFNQYFPKFLMACNTEGLQPTPVRCLLPPPSQWWKHTQRIPSIKICLIHKHLWEFTLCIYKTNSVYASELLLWAYQNYSNHNRSNSWCDLQSILLTNRTTSEVVESTKDTSLEG